MEAIIVSIPEEDSYHRIKECLIGKRIIFNQILRPDGYFEGPFEIPEGHTHPEEDVLCYSGYAYRLKVEIIEE